MEEKFKKLEFDQKWDEHFEVLANKSRTHSTLVANYPGNIGHNRYVNVTPYDKTRVKLIDTSRMLEDTDYINASYVTVPKAARKYILTQGPLPLNIDYFWLMVWEQRSNVIVMLNRLVEPGFNHATCAQYWPHRKDEKMHLQEAGLTVTLSSVKETKHYTVREMILEDDKKESRSITQFHYTAWPDHGQPDSPTSILRLLAAVRKSGGLDRMDEPTIVHCSAGIGRSGTFCLIDSILSIIENQGSTEGIDIDNTLVEMRDHRMGLIQTSTQLRFAYMSIIYGVKILEKANKLYPHISSIKDSSVSYDNPSQQKTNGFSSTTSNNNGTSKLNNGKKSRRGKKASNKQGVSSTDHSNSLNIFNKQLLVDTLDGVDSDSAERLFYDAMKPWPNFKKARNSLPDENDDAVKEELSKSSTLITTADDESTSGTDHDKQQATQSSSSACTRAKMLSNAINSLLTENTISTNPNSLLSDSTANQGTDSVLLRRRERELRNQRIAEKTMDIKKRMKAEELKRELYAKRMSFVKKSALFGGVALVLSSLVYAFLHSSS